MATTNVYDMSLPGGLGTLTLNLYARGGTTVVNTGGDTAAADAAGRYVWGVAEALAGIYDAEIKTSGGVRVGGGVVAIAADDTNNYAINATAIDTDANAQVSATNVYHADIELTVDETNLRDEYSAVWYKDGVRITSGITSPTIQVIKRVDGTDLIASTAMTQIGSTGAYKYDEATSRVIAGEAVVVVVNGTIDSAARTFARALSRDSA
jgi:hypothetical protein